jgi:hypothetical protein
MNRRLCGLLDKRLGEVGFDQVQDDRDERGKRWPLGALLRSVVGAMLAGAQSLAQVEQLSERMSRPVRRLLGVGRRVPDTTLRDVLCCLEPAELRKPLHALVKSAQRRKALDPDELPFGVVSLDGKGFSIPASDDWYAQRQTGSQDGPLVGVVRSVTATLSSHSARPIIDVFPIPAPTNEMGTFEPALAALCDAYSGLFELVCYDAGACSAANARLVRERGLHYLFALTAAQPTLLEEAKRWLGSRSAAQADATSEDQERGTSVVRRLYLGEAMAAPEGWQSLHTVLRIETEIRDRSGRLVSHDERYLISSLPACRLTKQHWLSVVRRRWGVETAHQILDTALSEDDHPWIEANPRAALVVAILRRIAYTLLTLFRSVTQRSDERRNVPWKQLMADVFFALVTTSDAELAGLRRHRVAELR